MTLGFELLGAFVAGIGFTIIFLAITIPKLGPRLIRWQMQRTMGARAKS